MAMDGEMMNMKGTDYDEMDCWWMAGGSLVAVLTIGDVLLTADWLLVSRNDY